MKIRDDVFAVYKGDEYRLVILHDERLKLVSHSADDQKKGFLPSPAGHFTLDVKKEDLTDYYSVNTYVRYKGHRFGIFSVEGDKVLIFSDFTPQKAQELGLQPADRGVYEKWVTEGELEKVWEEKSAIQI